MKIRGKKFIFAAMAAAALSVPVAQIAAPVVTFAEEAAEEMDITGAYEDRTSERASMEITKGDDGIYNVRIFWSSSATESTRWEFSGAYDAENRTLRFSDCVKQIVTLDDDEDKYETVYTEGTGTLINRYGSFFWVSNNESDSTEDVIFDKISEIPATYSITGEVVDEEGGAIIYQNAAKVSELVEVNVTPDKDYKVASVYAFRNDTSKEISVTKTDDETYTFIMPEADVKVYAKFEPVDSDVKEKPDLIGTWSDRISERATMEIKQDDDGIFHVKINWGNSANEMNVWEFSGEYDPELRRIRYSDCVKSVITTDENGKDTSETVYMKGTGALTYRDGTLFWVNDNEEDIEAEFVRDEVPEETTASTQATEDATTESTTTVTVTPTTTAGGTGGNSTGGTDAKTGSGTGYTAAAASSVQSSAPGTGDSNPTALWIVAGCAAAGVAVTVIAVRRKKAE